MTVGANEDNHIYLNDSPHQFNRAKSSLSDQGFYDSNAKQNLNRSPLGFQNESHKELKISR